MNKQILIVGNGYVGSAYARMLSAHYRVLIHDPGQNRALNAEQIAEAVLAIICVPTPMSDDGQCDTSIVRQAIAALPDTMPVLIKSTVTPGTTSAIGIGRMGLTAFSLEYIGEGGYYVPPEFPQPRDPASHGFMIVGAEHRDDAGFIFDLFMPVMGPTARYRAMGTMEAELVKYFENAFLAMKVMFATEMRDLCMYMKHRLFHPVNYHTVREGWLDDPRVGLSHSAAFGHKRGFDGKCLPKDTRALEAYANSIEFSMPMLSAVIKANGE